MDRRNFIQQFAALALAGCGSDNGDSDMSRQEYSFQPSPHRSGYLPGATAPGYGADLWVPSLGGTSVIGAKGRYIKIGPLVWVSCTIVVTSIGSGSTTAISGLPYPALNGGHWFPGSAYWVNAATAVVNVTPYVSAGASTIEFASLTAAGTSLGGNPIFGNGSIVYCQVHYLADA